MIFQYTIIIPHYRIPNLLRRCLWSIPKRDDLQVLVIDDHSGTQTETQLHELERDFPYVSIIYSKENGGGGRARNIGLQHAKGKYVLFADADDFFNYCINDILDEYIETDCDIVFFNAGHIDTDTYLSTKRGTTLQTALEMYDKTGEVSYLKYLFGEPWCKLVRKEMLDKNNITFEEIIVHNDTKFSYMAGFYANKVKFDNRAIYCLADRSGSVSKGLTDEKLLIRTKVFAEKNRFLADHNIPIFDNLMLTSFRTYMKRLDFKHLNDCFAVAEEYGYSKYSILTLFVIRKLKYLLCFRWI